MLIVINHITRPDRLVGLPTDWKVWTTTTPIGQTYHQVALTAVAEGWDLDTVVIQDDVRGAFPPVDRFTIYGTETSPGHICPRAFTADKPIWKHLVRRWARHSRSACPAITHLARHAQVLDTVHEVG